MKGNALIHFIKCLLGFDRPDTQTTKREQQAISKYAQHAKAGVEIGVFEGVNTITIAAAMHAGGKLIGIDPFFKGKLGICYHEKIARHSISKIKLLALFSYDAIKEVPDDADFIFIDGDHSYEGFKRDWFEWSVKLATNGIIALHDTSVPGHDASVKNLGSYKFFNEHVKLDNRFEILETIDSLNILRKKIPG
jgi:predicted O-methyltransferase YrrM